MAQKEKYKKISLGKSIDDRKNLLKLLKRSPKKKKNKRDPKEENIKKLKNRSRK